MKKTWVLVAVAAVLSVTTILPVVEDSFSGGLPSLSRGMTLVAEKLTEKPDMYIPLTEPDHYVLQAVSNPGEEVVVGAWGNSEFDEMVETYGTNNVEINGNYYQIQVYSKENLFWGNLFWLSLAGWFVFGIVCLRNRRGARSKGNPMSENPLH